MAGRAAFNSGGNDGFKIASVTVAGAPEPAAGAMMIIGFGAVGFLLHGRRARGAADNASGPVDAAA